MSFKVLNYESYYRLLIGSSVHLWYDRKVRLLTGHIQEPWRTTEKSTYLDVYRKFPIGLIYKLVESSK
jgi:hypothetical protein